MALLLLVALTNCAVAEDLPREADLRACFAELGLTPKSQAPRGCCSLFALTGVLEYELAQAGGAKPVRLAEEFLNWASHQSNGRRTDGQCAWTRRPHRARLEPATSSVKPHCAPCKTVRGHQVQLRAICARTHCPDGA